MTEETKAVLEKLYKQLREKGESAQATADYTAPELESIAVYHRGKATGFYVAANVVNDLIKEGK